VKRTPPELEGSRYWLPFGAFAALVVPALLLIRPGSVVVDDHAGLLLDPGGALRDAVRIWDADRALGTVTVDELGRMWPFGAFHWLMDLARVPDWVAQRLWVAALLVAAFGGVLFLARAWRWRPAAGAAAASAYALSPFIATVAIDPESLLPFAGLPWLLGLSVQALRHRSWRHPALFGAVLATTGSSDTAAAVVLTVVPLAWLGHALWQTREVGRARAVTTLTKMGAVAVTASTWWVAGLTVRATNGINASRFVEPPEVVSQVSSAPEVLRGLGRLPVYGPEATAGVARYTQETWLLAATFALPVVAVLALGIARWRHRTFTIGLVVVGVVLAVGAHPTGSPSPIGALIRALERTEAGLGLRGLHAAVIAVVLGAALGVGSLVGAAAEQDARRGVAGAVAVAIVAVAAAVPLWSAELVPGERSREAIVSDDVLALAAALDARADGTRVLELPAIDDGAGGPAPEVGLDAVLRRPHAGRSAVPTGSAASTDLLRALDDRVQRGALPPEALAPLARLIGAGDVVVHTGAAPGAAALLEQAPGLHTRQRFGAAETAVVDEPSDRLRTHTGDGVVLLSGSGDGIIDAAAAGLLVGDELIRYSSTLTDDPDFVRTHLVGERRLIVTDTNRVRAQRWTGVRDVEGFTESVDGGLLDHDPHDRRLVVQPDRPGTRSVVETGAVAVQATRYGPSDRYRPGVRPVLAADGDPTSAWLVPAETAVGEELLLTSTDPARATSLRLLQATGSGSPEIREVRLRFDHGGEQDVILDDRSLAMPGQWVQISDRPFRTVTIEITGVEGAAAGDVGIAEVEVAGLVAEEAVRMPSDLLEAAGYRSSRYPLAVVQTRLRSEGGEDEEPIIRRLLELPVSRTYVLSGRARAAAGADRIATGVCRDDIVAIDGRAVPVRLMPPIVGGDLHLEGCEEDGVAIPGGDRRFTTAPSAVTGVVVDQLVWTSAPIQAAANPPADDPPALRTTSLGDTNLEAEVAGTRPGTPFWVLLGQSHDSGWDILDTDAQVDGPHLVNGYANGFLVTSAARDVTLQLRYLPQNRVDVALLISVVATLLVAGLALSRPASIRPPVPAQQEPLRRLRAFTYEGALPTRRDAVVVAVVGGVGGTLLAGPVVGAVLAALGGYATRREGWRLGFTLVPALLLVAAVGGIVLSQIDDGVPHSVDWPAQFATWHRVALAAVLLLALDTMIERAWRRNSLFD
jgi:arabinofuranan 3-O-arabinosyltransferase